MKTDAELREERRLGRPSLFVQAYDFLPTGNLTLTIESWRIPRKNWRDTAKHRLEEFLGEFVAAVRLVAASEKIKTQKRLEEKRRWEQAMERRRIVRKLRKTEMERFKRLEKAADDWHRARKIEEYIDALENMPMDMSSSARVARRKANIAWARGKIAWLDPMTRKIDTVLGRRCLDMDN